jgi:mannose-6-phosphate isomerase-like protein (cupin superfamily)
MVSRTGGAPLLATEVTMAKASGFSVSHGADARFTSGLRADLEYRDLGAKAATGGRFVAQLIRAVPGKHALQTRHRHEADFQLVYVTKGWLKIRYEGVGEVTLNAGSCVLSTRGLPHIELGHSEDLELIEIASPANFETVNE